MATGTFNWHGPAFKAAFNKEYDFDDGNTKLMLSSVAYVPDVDLHDYQNDVTNEVTGTNWATGGVTLGTPVCTVVGASNIVKFTCDDVVNAATTLTGARVAVIYNNTAGASSTDPIMGSIVFDSDLSPNAATLTIDFDNVNGFAKVTY